MRTMEHLYNSYAEESVIGGLLFADWTDKAVMAFEMLRPDDFYLRQTGIIWKAMIDMSTAGKNIDLLTLSDYMESNGIECEFSYLGEIAKNTPGQANIIGYAKIVKDLSKLRKALALTLDACDALQHKGDPEDRLNKALSFVAQIGAEDENNEFKTVNEVLSEALTKIDVAFKSGKSVVGLSSGFENIDTMTGGFREADLIILAARPSMGKTTLAMNIAENVAYFNQDKGNVLIISLEMPAVQLMNKTLSRAGGIYLNKILNGSVLDDTIYKDGPGRLTNAMEIITANQKNMLIDDKGGQHISQIMMRAKRAAMKMGRLDLVVVDYLQLVQADGESQTIRVGKVSAGLKELAKALKCPVIALSQLNRGLVGKPELKNLRDSGSIEQDADVVMFLHDDDYEGNRGEHSLTEVIFAKQRMAAIGSTYLQPELAMSRFADTQRLPAPKVEPEHKTYKKGKFE